MCFDEFYRIFKQAESTQLILSSIPQTKSSLENFKKSMKEFEQWQKIYDQPEVQPKADQKSKLAEKPLKSSVK